MQFKFGERVETIDLERTEVTTQSGFKARADLIVAADGLWSRCRAIFTGSNDPPRPTGDLAYHLVLNLDQVPDPKLRDWISKPTVHFWIGPGAHAVGYSLRAGRQYNIVLLVPDDLPEGVSRQPGSITEMKALFKDWDPTLSLFLDLVDGVEKWKLMHRKFACRYVIRLNADNLKNQGKNLIHGSTTRTTLSLCAFSYNNGVSSFFIG